MKHIKLITSRLVNLISLSVNSGFNNTMIVDDDFIKCIVDGQLQKLEYLALESYSVSNEGLKLLLESSNFPMLKRLELKITFIEKIKRERFPQLSELQLMIDTLEGKSVRNILTSGLLLKELDMFHVDFNDRSQLNGLTELKKLKKFCMRFPRTNERKMVGELDLTELQIKRGEFTKSEFLDMIKNSPHLKSLYFHNMYFDFEILFVLSNMCNELTFYGDATSFQTSNSIHFQNLNKLTLYSDAGRKILFLPPETGGI